MNKFYSVLSTAAALLFSGVATAQSALSISPCDTVVCAGSNVSLTANTTVPTTALTTTCAAGNNHRGNMFDITATNTVTIQSFDAHPMGNTTIEIYYRASP